MPNHKTAKYRVKNANGEYDIIYLETIAEQVIESEDKQFITQLERELISKPTHYTHEQMVPSGMWIIQHNLDKFPSVTITDSAGSVVYGEITYKDKNVVHANFSAGFSGTAYCN